MASKQAFGNEISVDEQALEHERASKRDDEGFEVVDETPDLRATVEQEKQAKVDSNHPDGMVQDFSHLPLAQEERIRAREAELERISAQAELGTQEGRAKRSREVVRQARRKQWHSTSHEDPDEDPRETLDRVTLAKVNREADRIAERLDGVHTRAGVSRALAKRVVDGQDLTEAVFATMNALKAAPGTICPIADVPDVPTDEVSVRGTIDTLWEPSDPAIQQVGLIADDTGRTKFTVWRKSQCTAVAEGETVRFRGAKVNWYQGQWSLALTYDSRIEFPERDPRWWDA